MNTMTVADLTARTGTTVLDHIPTELEIPVLSGPQAQGDVIVLPTGPAAAREWEPVPVEGVVLVAGIHDHRLVADPGTCEIAWTPGSDLDVAVIRCVAPVWLLHMEHGGSGLAPGEYVVRRQREQAEQARIVAD